MKKRKTGAIPLIMLMLLGVAIENHASIKKITTAYGYILIDPTVAPYGTLVDKVQDEGTSYGTYKEGVKSIKIPATFRDTDGSEHKIRIGGSYGHNYPNLVSVEIEDGIEEIGSGAFTGCPKLKTVKLSKDVKGGYSTGGIFSNCSLIETFIYGGTKPIDLGAQTLNTSNNVTIYVPGFAMKSFRNTDVRPWKGKMIKAFVSIETNAPVYNFLKQKLNTDTEYFMPEDMAKITSVNSQNPANLKHFEEFEFFTGVKEISSHAFLNTTALTSITIPNSVTSIGFGAFSGCSGLTSITIPNSVTSIGSSAFSGCTGLTSVTIGKSVTSIGESAFEGCTGITSITIPNSVTNIGNSAFYECSGLTSVTIGNSVTSLGDHAFYSCTGLTSVTIPNSVTLIADYAFSGCTGLTSVTIPNSVTSIGEAAFVGCTGLTSVTIPNSVTSIGEAAFVGCTGLTSVTIPNSVTSIGAGAFEGCTGLTSVTIPESVTYIGWSAFNGCKGLTSVSIPNSVQSIERNTFYNCTELKSLTIGNSVTSIGDYAFYGCSNLETIYYSNSLESIGNSAFSYSKIKDYYINVVDISHDFYHLHLGLFSHDQSNRHYMIEGKEVIDLVIPDSITAVGSGAFRGCKTLKSVAVSNTTKIGGDASLSFVGCDSLTDVYIKVIDFSDSNSSKGWYSIAPNVHCIVNDKEITDLVIPDSVTTITDCFRGFNLLKSVTIPNSVTSINNYAFQGCASLTNVTIPNSVTSIGYGAFSGCTGLTSITIPNTATVYIYDGYYYVENFKFPYSASFKNCPKLSDIYVEILNFNNDNIYYKIAPNVHYLMGGEIITDLVIPNSITGIKDYAFFGGTELTSVTIPNSVTSIGDYAFSGCTRLTSITIPNSVTSIGNVAFSGCSGLTSITIPNSVTSIGEYAFYKCTGQTSITIPNSVTSIGFGAFSGCTGLTSVTIGNSVTSIGNYAFEHCSGLTSVTIPESVTSIGAGAFEGCTGLTSVTIPESVTYIGWSAFAGCTGLTSVTIPNSVTSIGRSAFNSCSGLTLITIPNSVTSIGYKAFDGCTGLTSVIIPESVTLIEDSAFVRCTDLEDVYIYGVPRINTNTANGVFYAENQDRRQATLHVPKGYESSFVSYSDQFSRIVGDLLYEPVVKTIYECEDIDLINLDYSKALSQDTPYGVTITITDDNRNPDVQGNVSEGKCQLITPSSSAANPQICYDLQFLEGVYDISVVVVPENIVDPGNTSPRANKIKATITTDTISHNTDGIFVSNTEKIDTILLFENYHAPAGLYRSLTISSCLKLADRKTCTPYLYLDCIIIKKKVPANDDTDSTLNKYTLKFVAEGQVVSEKSVDYGSTITVPTAPTKKGYSFVSWGDVAATMPAKDMTYTAQYKVNQYKLTYMIDGRVYKTYTLDYNSVINPEGDAEDDDYYYGWEEIPDRMPDHDVTVNAYITGIAAAGKGITNGKYEIYTIDGKKLNNLQKGVNIIRLPSGKTKKVVIR